MKRCCVVLMVMFALSVTSVALAQVVEPQVEPQVAPPVAPQLVTSSSPHGLGVSVLVGMNACLKHRDASCENIDPSFGFSGGLLYRFFDFLAVDGNFHYGMYNVTGASSGSSLGVLFGPKGFYTLYNVDLFLGLGFGWGQYKFEGTYLGQSASQKVSGFEMGLSFGAEYLVLKNLGVGLGAKFFFPFFDKGCYTLGSQEQCGDVSGDLQYEMMFGLSATYYFGI